MKMKIVVGIVVVIAIVIGIGFAFTNSENNIEDNSNISTDEIQNIESSDNSEGKQFTIELSDSVSTTGP